jgi:hypothetical protein
MDGQMHGPERTRIYRRPGGLSFGDEVVAKGSFTAGLQGVVDVFIQSLRTKTICLESVYVREGKETHARQTA